MAQSDDNLTREPPGRPENGKFVRPRSFSAPPPDPAEALYYEGMAAYQHRNWEQALDRFSRLKELQPSRPGLDALLDEVRWFLQLQATAPSLSKIPDRGPGSDVARREPAAAQRPPQSDGTSRSAGPWRRWQTAAVIALGLIGVLALVLIALGGQLPWAAASGREAQELYNRGQARLAVGDYEGAQAAFKRLLEITPNDPEAAQGLQRAERQQTLAQGYAAAEAAMAEDDWDTAANELAAVLAVDPGYRDAQKKADFVAQRRRLVALYADGSRLYDLDRWEEAITQFTRIRELDSTYRKEVVDEFLFVCYLNAGLALIDSAEGKVATVQRALENFSNALAIHPRNRGAADARRLGTLYLDAVRALANNNLSEAQARLETLLAEVPTYANGQAAGQLYTLLLRRGEVALQKGDISAAIRFYQDAQSISVPDHTAAVQGEAYARAITPTPTPRPTTTPHPTSLPSTPTPYAVARSDMLNVRSGPGTVYPIVAVVHINDALAIIGSIADGAWLQVCCVAIAEGGAATESGWVASPLVEVQGSLAGLAIITPPPSPTPIAQARPMPGAPSVVCLAGRVRDTGGRALSGWTITLQGPGGLTRSQKTDADGTYRFENLAAGTYIVSELLESGWRAVSPQSSSINLAPASACAMVDFWNEHGGQFGPTPTTKPGPTSPPPSPTPPR